MTTDGVPVPGDDDYELTGAQIPVVSAAWRFLEPFYKSGDLAGAWRHVDPLLQLCWVQWWVDANRSQIENEGLDLDDLATALVADNRDHPLWRPFQRVIVRDFRSAFPANPQTWGIGTAPRLLAPDIELLYLHPEAPEGGFWQPGASARVIPLVMHWDGEGWRVLNLGSNRIPEPGWPPQLQSAHPPQLIGSPVLQRGHGWAGRLAGSS